jgi:CTP synthase (UTP-ammonia lyase)
MTGSRPLDIGLIGDWDETVLAHRAILLSIAQAAARVECRARLLWLPTMELVRDLSPAQRCDGLWCVPATPYRSAEGAISAIQWARTSGTPFLGTCGGYQHALLEYARNVLGWNAAHAEEDPDAELPLITLMACELIETDGIVRLQPGSRLASICGSQELREGYHCRYGLDPGARDRFDGGPLRIVGEDPAGDPRAFELDGHPFFFGTAFQPERASLAGHAHPLVVAFVQAALNASRGRSTS